jgi:hypothetical protein
VVLPAGRRKVDILGLRAQLLRFIDEWRPDIIHSHLYRTNRALMRALLLIPRSRRPASSSASTATCWRICASGTRHSLHGSS